MSARLRSEVWVQALLRRLDNEAIFAAVRRRGDADAGTVLVKVNRFANGCVVYTRVYDVEGERVWMRGTGEEPVDEEKADAYMGRQAGYDPDCWIVEVEDPAGRFTLDDEPGL